MNKFLISVIIPIFNQEEYLPTLFKSLLNQDLKSEDFQLLLIDDGSLDFSAAICHTLKKKHPELNITYFHQENAGLSAARNTGISLAEGKYVLFMDSDDILAPGSLGYLKEVLLQNDADYIGFGMKWVDIRKGNLEFSYHSTNFSASRTKTVDGWKLIERASWPSSACVGLYRTKFLKTNNLNFTIGIIAEDCCFNLQFFLKNPKCKLSSAIIYYYLFRSQSLMTSISRKSAQTRLYSYHYLLSQLYNACHSYPDFANGLKRVLIHQLEVFTPQLLQLNLPYHAFRQYADNFIKDRIVPVEFISPKCYIANLIFRHPVVYPLLSTCYKYLFYPLYRGLQKLKHLIHPSGMCYDWSPISDTSR